MIRLIPAEDAHFAWLLGETSAPNALRGAPGGVEERDVLRWLRQVASHLAAMDRAASWLITAGDEVVGLCGLKRPPDAASAEIGYGIAASRRGEGRATEAVRLMCAEIGRTGGVNTICAETVTGNFASQRVLERNGFVRAGTRHDPSEGELVLWSKSPPFRQRQI